MIKKYKIGKIIIGIIFFIIILINIHLLRCFAEENKNDQEALKMQQLIKDLEGCDSEKINALIKLKELKDKRAVPYIINLLNDKWNIRWRAAEALGEIKDERAIIPLINRLKIECTTETLKCELTLRPLNEIYIGYTTADEFVRSQFAIALRKINGEEVITRLKPLLNSQNSNLRYEVSLILGGLKIKEALPVLIEALEKSQSGALRSQAAQVLGELGDNSAIPALKRALKDNFQHPQKKLFMVRYNAAIALKNLGIQVDQQGDVYIIKE